MSRKSRKRDNNKSSTDSKPDSTADVAADSQGESTAEFFMTGTDEKSTSSKKESADAKGDSKAVEEPAKSETDSVSDVDDAPEEMDKTDEAETDLASDVDDAPDEADEDEINEVEKDEEETPSKKSSSNFTSSTRIEPEPAPKSIAMVDTSSKAVSDKTDIADSGPVRDSRGSIFDRWFAADSGKRLRARKVRRVIRHIDPWSVLTFSVIFHLVVVGSLFIATLLVVVLSVQLNLLEQVETQIQQLFNLEVFEIRLRPLATALAQFSFILVILGTLLHVLFAVIFNLISDLVGGIRVTVVEEEISTSSK